ncbi:hypothetical protein Tco_0565364 [Tanacetum coccineum]
MKGSECVKKKVKIAPHDYSKENYLATFTPQKQLTPEQIIWSDDLLKMKAKALKEKAKSAKPIIAMMVYPPNTPAKLRITPTGLTEGERGFEQTKSCYLTEVIPFFKTIKEHFEGIQKALVNEIKEMKEVFDKMEAEVDQHAVDKKCDEIERKNILIENENLIAECLSKDYQHLKERFGNKKSVTSLDGPVFESVFEIGNLKEQLQGRGNTIRELKEKISCLQKKHSEADPILNFKALDSQNKDLNAKVNALQDLNKRFRVENKKVKQHYKELYDSIQLTFAKTIDNTTSLLNEIETLKAQIKGKTNCVTMPDPVKPKVLAPGMYAIDVELIPPRNRNNREVHLEYLKHLKECVGTLCEIVEEARVEKPFDSLLASACLYTKHSQELLEYVISTYPKDFNKRDRKIATAPLNKKSELLLWNQTNEPMIPSTGVKDATAASESKPRSNTKKDRTLSGKSDKKKVEDHSRDNKSSVKQKNRIDSSISYKRTWQPTGRKFTLGEQCPLTRFTESKVVHVKQPKRISTSDIVITKRFSNTSHKPLTRIPTAIRDLTYQTLHIHLFSNEGRIDRPLVFGLRFGNDHFGAIMGYGDYVIGDSVISRILFGLSPLKTSMRNLAIQEEEYGTISHNNRESSVISSITSTLGWGLCSIGPGSFLPPVLLLVIVVVSVAVVVVVMVIVVGVSLVVFPFPFIAFTQFSAAPTRRKLLLDHVMGPFVDCLIARSKAFWKRSDVSLFLSGKPQR